jgi:hypothetical protein
MCLGVVVGQNLTQRHKGAKKEEKRRGMHGRLPPQEVLGHLSQKLLCVLAPLREYFRCHPIMTLK